MRVLTIIFILILISLPIIIAETTINPLSKSYADSLYCWLDGTNCAGGSGGASDTMSLYVDTSSKNVVTWNISDAEEDVYKFPIHGGEHYVLGGSIE